MHLKVPGRVKYYFFSCVKKIKLLLNFYHCPFCLHIIYKYHPLPKIYSSRIIESGGIPVHKNAETCNYKNYSCPIQWCQGVDRDRLIALYFDQYIEEFKSLGLGSLSVLDIAPDSCLSNYIKSKISRLDLNSSYVSADLVDPNVDLNIDITNMHSVKDNSFSLIICSHVLEHIPDDIQALNEIFRVLEHGGIAILLVPINLKQTTTDEDISIKDPKEKIRRFGDPDHVRRYSKYDFMKRIINTGFKLETLGINHFGKNTFEKYALTPTSCLYIAKKI